MDQCNAGTVNRSLHREMRVAYNCLRAFTCSSHSGSAKPGGPIIRSLDVDQRKSVDDL